MFPLGLFGLLLHEGLLFGETFGFLEFGMVEGQYEFGYVVPLGKQFIFGLGTQEAALFTFAEA